ncbi:hypothetical protein YYC_05846 [Plasmodium yoelii 17X]|uniref:Uncharacterized protein n=1 Tax=Plasmodium yoelii 17X TaxID=1323249 RepID=V7PBK1_PLAYE|nr:hypothetical protein YYC_05846 [Plasmodium yoelii 17X]
MKQGIILIELNDVAVTIIICEKFRSIWDKFPDTLDSNNNYQFKEKNFLDSYCDDKSCDTDFRRIDGGCLYLFKQIFGTSELFKSVANSNINIVDYILIWLSYMLNLKPEGTMSNIHFFYKTTIDNDRYKNTINGVPEYSNYKYLIDKKKYFLDMDKKIISNFYEAFKLLCLFKLINSLINTGSVLIVLNRENYA